MMRRWLKVLPLFVVEWLAWNWPPWNEGKKVHPSVSGRWEKAVGPPGVVFRRPLYAPKEEGSDEGS